MRHLAPLVGRTDELARLGSLVGLAGGAPGRVLVAGDAGSGKTRLLSEVSARAERDGWQVLTGHCLDIGDSGVPYLPFIEALGRIPPDDPTLAEAPAAIRRLLPAHRDAATDTAAPDRVELLEAVHATLRRLAASVPLLLVVEDVHWADPSTRDLLGSLFARPDEGRFAVVASYRGEDVHRRHPLRPTLAEWARLPGLARLNLAPLPAIDARQLVHELRPHGLSAEQTQRIVDRAEGNPFYVEELVAASGDGVAGLPPDLADVLLVRMDRLDPEAQAVLRTLSIAGHQVPHDVLAAVTGLPPAELDRAIRTALEANLLVIVDRERYGFRHSLLAEAVYSDLLPGEHVRLHAAYARALADGDRPGFAAELARHSLAAHDAATAAAASVRAGDEAMALGGPEEALRHFETALELAADPAAAAALPFSTSRLVVRAGLAATAAGRAPRAVSLTEAQLRALPSDAPPADRARLLWALVTFELLVETDRDLLALATEAERLAPDPDELRADVLTVLARALADRARFQEARTRAEQARQLAQRLGAVRTVAEAELVLARIQEKQGDAEGLLGLVEEVAARARRHDDVAGELRALYTLGRLHFELGHLSRALELHGRSVARGAEVGRPWAPYALESRTMTALVAYVKGDWQLADRIVEVADEPAPPEARAYLAAVGLQLAAARGELAAAARIPSLREYWRYDGMIAVSAGGAGIDLLGLAGDLDAARRLHADVVAMVAPLWGEHFPAQVRLGALLLGQLAAAVDRTGSLGRPALVAEGAALLDRVQQAAGSGPPMGPEGSAWALRAAAEDLRLRWLAGEQPAPARLVAAWREAAAAFEAFGHVPETARSRVRLAYALRTAGEVEEAIEQAELARETGLRLGAAPVVAESLAILGPRGPEPRSREAGRGGEDLTPREEEVLELLVAGRSNREIAGRLYISVKTVSVHVSNILAKLGASSRTEAAALARRST